MLARFCATLKASPFVTVFMSPQSDRAQQKLVSQVLDRVTPDLTQLCQQAPEALFAVTDLWRLWADRNTSVSAFDACFNTLIDNGWMNSLEILESAVELQRPNAIRALQGYLDLATIGISGYHLHEGQDVRELREFPNDNGWVARAAYERDEGVMDLPLFAEVSGQPTVWCESLPMLGTRVSWLELALGTGLWKNAESLWELEAAKGPLENQACARLALAFFAGIVGRGGALHLPEQEHVILQWWDRLLPTTLLMTEEVAVEPEWAQKVLLGTDPKPGAEEEVAAVLRPIDMMPAMVAQLSIRDGLANPIRQRLKAVDWSTVAAVGRGRLPAHAAWDHYQRHRQKDKPALYDHLWVNLLQGVSSEQKDLWWRSAFSNALSNPAPLAATSDLFKGHYGLEDTQSLFQEIVDEVDYQKRGRSAEQAHRSQSRMAQALVNEVLPPVIACSAPDAMQAWEGYRDGLATALKDTSPSLASDDERWRALDMAFRLPLPKAPRPKMRF